MAITPLSTAPNRSMDPLTFSDVSDEWVAGLALFTTEVNATVVTMNTLLTNTTTQASNALASKDAAAISAAAAAASAAAAATTAGATKWNAATNYAQGASVWSPTNFLTYRRRSAGTSATDPGLGVGDPTNWQLLSGKQGMPAVTVSSNTTTQDGIHYVMGPPPGGPGSLVVYTLSLNPNPVDQEAIQITNLSGRRTMLIDPGAKKIRDEFGIMKMDDYTFSRQLTYIAARSAWV